MIFSNESWDLNATWSRDTSNSVMTQNDRRNIFLISKLLTTFLRCYKNISLKRAWDERETSITMSVIRDHLCSEQRKMLKWS